MSFKIVRNDITKMQTDAIVNTANELPTVGPGCDHAVYEAAGYDELLSYRKAHIGGMEEGEAFITPGFRLPAKYIIHAVSPLFVDGNQGEEELLRSCYRKSLALAVENGIRSIAFPLISTGSFGYPKEEGMRIAVDEIHAFLLTNDMQIYLVVFDEKATQMGRNLYPDLEAYIDLNYVQEKREEEYGGSWYAESLRREEAADSHTTGARHQNPESPRRRRPFGRIPDAGSAAYPGAALPPAAAPKPASKKKQKPGFRESFFKKEKEIAAAEADLYVEEANLLSEADPLMDEDAAFENMERGLKQRMEHMTDTFPQYLLYLISQKGMENMEVYKRAIVDKKVFSKIKNNPDYHPQKLTALCLCIGAKLNLDESRDLLARAGYALSPCDKTDIIFSYFIENKIYDMIELDIQLEEHGLPCIIT